MNKWLPWRRCQNKSRYKDMAIFSKGNPTMSVDFIPNYLDEPNNDNVFSPYRSWTKVVVLNSGRVKWGIYPRELVVWGKENAGVKGKEWTWKIENGQLIAWFKDPMVATMFVLRLPTSS